MIPAAREIWEEKYRFRSLDGKPERCIEESGEQREREPRRNLGPSGSELFTRRCMGSNFFPAGGFWPAGGTGRKVTLFNCFVLGEIGDSMESIFA